MNTDTEKLGLNSELKRICDKQKIALSSLARVISEHREAYILKSIDGEYFARVTGKQIFSASDREDYPVVGDWVVFEETDEGKAVIREILPRFSLLKRKFGDKNNQNGTTQLIASNIDMAFVVQSADRDYSLNRFERYFIIIEDAGIKPVAILNKIDLLEKAELEQKITQFENRFPGADLIAASSARDQGVGDIRKVVTVGKTYCFLGSSGVGKSSLINNLIGKNEVKTSEISSHSDRGRHTTTGRQMYFLESGGILIDNPGIREVGITGTSGKFSGSSEDISGLARDCKFQNCTHVHEPGCRVIEAKEAGILSEDQYQNYLRLQKEAAYNEMDGLEKRKKDRQFGKFIKKAKEDLEKI